MSYWLEDIGYFVGRAPYLQMASPERAAPFLARQVELEEQSYVRTASYPEDEAACLSFFYVTIMGLSILDARSLELMSTQFTWRGLL